MERPRPAEAWDGVREATAYGPTAPKGDYPERYRTVFPEVKIDGADYLNLNVWTREEASGWPVMVWIHGGSFTNGSGSLGEYSGHAFARDGVVCVTINYRLGAHGFLHFDDGVANVGMLDQVAALAWVRDNIAAFGGDPDRVTIAGESAGAVSVMTLMAMPSAQGLFQRAIAQSGYAGDILDPELAHYMASQLAERLGVAATRAAVADVPHDRLVEVAAVMAADVELDENLGGWAELPVGATAFTPVVDAATLPRAPMDAMRDGSAVPVDLLVGWNRDETRLELVSTGELHGVDRSALEEAADRVGLPAEALRTYVANRPGSSEGDVLAAVLTDWAFGISAIRAAEARLEGGASNTWVYRFDHPAPHENGGLGACHGVEIPYVFDCLDRADMVPRLGPTPSRSAARLTHGTWVSFIRNGDPGWPTYDLDRRSVGLLGPSLTVVEDPNADERETWDGIR